MQNITITIKKPEKVNILLSSKSAFIKSPYNENLVKYIRNLHNRYWHSEEKLWEIEESDLVLV